MKKAEETDTQRLMKAIELMAGKIANDLELQAKGEKDDEGNEIEVSHKLVDTYVKLVSASDKIQAFSALILKMDKDEGTPEPVKKKNIQDMVLNK